MPVKAAPLGTSDRAPATQLILHQPSGIPVAEPDGTALGMVTKRDVLRQVQAGKPLASLPAGEILSPAPENLGIETDLSEAIGILLERILLRLPVTSRGKRVGTLSATDVIRTTLEPKFTEVLEKREIAPFSGTGGAFSPAAHPPRGSARRR